MTAVAATRYATVQKTPRVFPKVYSSFQNIGNRHCFLVGGGRQIVSPSFSNNPV